MQKPKLLVISVLATILVCSALSVAAAQEENPPVPKIANDTITSTDIAPERPQSTPLDGNHSDSDVDDLAPIYAANGEPAFGVPEDGDDTGAPLIPPAPNSTAPDNTLAIVAIVVALVAIIGGAVGVVYHRKQVAETSN